ncbi:hypothetical protein ABT297_08335 [Dactylosporangium sp. NPDC000555]|uniref:hypothetical protein n=1 Tax=Dactylosporangium sp. NPDC000555 TaxID=3154260 RepID=UPI00333338A9
MTQQEQYHDTGLLPGPRTDAHDEDYDRDQYDPDQDAAVGTAHAPHADPDDGGAAGRYPAGTYTSGPADAADREDATLVDRDEAPAGRERAETADRLDDARTDRPFDTDARAEATDDVSADAGRGNEVRDADARASEEDDEWAESDIADAEAAEDEHRHAGRDDTVADGTDPAVRDAPVAEEQARSESLPGAVDVAAVGVLWADGAVDGLKERWSALQLRFIDDPRAVAGEADRLIGEAVDTLTGSLQAQRRQLADWQSGPGDDTERLRAAVRGYRDFLDRLLGV